jgi:hypothetical protein
MFTKISKPTAATLLTAVIATVCACHSDDVTPPLTLTTMAATTQPSSSQPVSFVGTVPAPRADEPAITPAETVGAMPN